MRKIEVILSVAAIVMAGLVLPSRAGCGACGPAEAKAVGTACTKAGETACKKSCCGTKDTAACKAACKAECAKTGCAAKIAKTNTTGLKAMMDAGVKVTLLDARTGKYDDGRRIPGAGSLAPNATAEDAAKAIPSKEALVVTYCSSTKCPASEMLAAQLKKLGYSNVIKYPEGIAGWAEAGLDVEKAKQ
jgi:rhodanese-related sulfurtransferase